MPRKKDLAKIVPRRVQRRARKLAAVPKGAISMAEASAAAVYLGQRRARLAGKEGMAALGRLGAAAFWAGLNPAERTIEHRRRAATRKKNRAAKLAALLAKA